MNYTITTNPAYNSIEILFDSKPSEEIRAALKELRFRWHSVKKIWYGYSTEEAVKSAIESKPNKPTAGGAAANKYGVKVGDLFYTSWGYEQTNVNFFQVIGLKGEASVIVREVYPEMVSEDAVSGMSANRAYKTTSEILPPASHASFINDNENGDVRRVQFNDYNGKPYFKVGRRGRYQDTAHPYNGETLYESWYA